MSQATLTPPPQQTRDPSPPADDAGPAAARLIWSSPARMHGEPCFRGTRVPVQTLFDHLRAGDPLADFLRGFPDVDREAAVAVIDLAAAGVLRGPRDR